MIVCTAPIIEVLHDIEVAENDPRFFELISLDEMSSLLPTSLFATEADRLPM
jgi:hypothetical protein